MTGAKKCKSMTRRILIFSIEDGVTLLANLTSSSLVLKELSITIVSVFSINEVLSAFSTVLNYCVLSNIRE